MNDDQNAHLPSPEAIAAATAEIRNGWSPREARVRQECIPICRATRSPPTPITAPEFTTTITPAGTIGGFQAK